MKMITAVCLMLAVANAQYNFMELEDRLIGVQKSLETIAYQYDLKSLGRFYEAAHTNRLA